MDLGEWIEKEGMTINEFCRRVDIIPFNMYQVIRDETKKRKVGLEYAFKIFLFTRGEVGLDAWFTKEEADEFRRFFR